jgi:hypothetical protein
VIESEGHFVAELFPPAFQPRFVVFWLGRVLGHYAETLSALIYLTFSLRRFATAAINNLGSIGFARWS